MNVRTFSIPLILYHDLTNHQQLSINAPYYECIYDYFAGIGLRDYGLKLKYTMEFIICSVSDFASSRL